MTRHYSEGLSKLELRLKAERKEILLQEELLWKQKSRCEWLKAGKGNTRFFHTSTLVQRRRNHVEALQNDSGEWVVDTASLKDMAVNFYAQLFQSDTNVSVEFTQGHFPRPSVATLHLLEAGYLREETRKALMSMGPLKAPGPDGFQRVFFSKKLGDHWPCFARFY